MRVCSCERVCACMRVLLCPFVPLCLHVCVLVCACVLACACWCALACACSCMRVRVCACTSGRAEGIRAQVRGFDVSSAIGEAICHCRSILAVITANIPGHSFHHVCDSSSSRNDGQTGIALTERREVKVLLEDKASRSHGYL